MKFKSCLFLLLLIPLTACGEGWELKLTDTYFPYGNKRTAGSGVAYVLAKMMPAKNLRLEPEMALEMDITPVSDNIVQELEHQLREKKMK